MMLRLVLSLAALSHQVSAQRLAAPWNNRNKFDIQAHRGGIGHTVESTLEGFAEALAIGVSTLELDVQITSDGHAVVTHDRQISSTKCQDTVAAFTNDPQFPYVGKYIVNLTLAQVWMVDCGSMPLPEFPDQQLVRGARLALLSQVFDLVKESQADNKVWLNIETKVEIAAPNETASQQVFVDTVVAEIEQANMMDQVTIQSFDWGALMLMRETAPTLPIVALTNGDFLEVRQPGASVWLGGIDIDDFDGDVVAAVASFGADALSPVHGNPQDGKVSDPDYVAYTTPDLVARAHAAGIAVIPWTVDDRATMVALLDAGVDGIITNYPDRLRELVREYGYVLPPYFAAPESKDDTMAPQYLHYLRA